jgi:hypothetical protein
MAPNNFAIIREKILAEDVKHKNYRVPSRMLRVSLITILFLLFAGSVTVAAYNLTGADFFKKYFGDKINNNDLNYNQLDLDQLDEMSSSTIGTVVDTDEITIDVLGIISNGNTAKIMLRITANQLETVLRETDMGPLQNYRFNDDCGGTLWEYFDNGSIGYYYSDEVDELAPNQFEILYTIVGYEPYNGKQYTLELSKFGYFTSNAVNQFVSLYDKRWSFQINLDSMSNSYKAIYINKPTNYMSNEFNIYKVQITPFACGIEVQFSAVSDDIASEMSRFIYDEIPNIKLNFSDGSVLNSSYFDNYSSGGDISGSKMYIPFSVPIAVDDVVSITIFGTDYELN